ncbi:CoA transferase subunit A [Ornithinibacillus halophilus]|uniref:3-oxoacid CoA-transferase subunit A n=1 Tax=Ornithinibacillus halophilus TaxID=930117 RepID=A0A1M5GK97_9BACI|nr:CoA transferase subunit A [Ornithinibacillus halophilus]SHG04116.1 3-oxoacid CoA-transferase subunit A [Ornithinibacillus halophilus]
MNKELKLSDVIQYIKDGDKIMVGGFGLIGTPLKLIEELANSEVKNLTIISNNLGEQGKGLGKLVLNGQVKKAVGSFFTSNKDVVNAYKNKEIEVQLLPQGTLSEAIRAGGAGIPGFFVPAAAGTQLSKDKEEKIFEGKTYILERSLNADVAFIKAHKADKLGNLVYEKSARNFNPIMASAAKLVIVEVDEVVEVGELSPEEIATPHLYVDYYVVKGARE